MSHPFLRRFISTLFILIFSFKLHAQTSISLDEHIHFEPTPEWVETREAKSVEYIPVDEINNGVFYQLVDNQIKVEKDGFRRSYSRYIETVVNQTGVEDSSQINLDFDPSYQKLALSTLTVIRDGQRIDRLKDAQISVFSRETDLNKQIYNGRLTLNILLDDIQVGDTIDLSYTRHGTNPVYKSIFSYMRSVNWSVPVYNQHIRVLWGKPTSLKVESQNIDPTIVAKQIDGITEYSVHLQNQKTVKVPSETPDWYNPYGRIHFNETQNWQDVVAWARPMYQFDTRHQSVEAVAAKIRESYSSQAEQIEAALKYTQEKIRYVGIEMGQNSHLPTAPEQTLALKYGDCKDKTSLLIAILNSLNIKAYPALVDTANTKLLADMPPATNLFDHVIVWLEFEGQQYWLDPTLSNQNGTLANLYQPDFGYALILKQGIDKLTSMQNDEQKSYVHVFEKYVIPDDTDSVVPFTVSTRYLGHGAMRQLWELEQNGKNSIAEDYEIYYQDLFPGLKTFDEMTVKEDPISGEVIYNESYQINNFWERGEKNWEADFYPIEIRNAIFKPKQTQRNGPLAFEFPDNIEKTTELHFETDGWSFGPEKFSEDNPFFSYASQVSFENNVLTLKYTYSAKTDHIPKDKINDYLKARERVRDDAYYGIIKYFKDPASTQTETTKPDDSTTEEDETINWWAVVAAVYCIGFLYIIVDWQIESRKRPAFSDSQFYPIAVWKFLYLSTITFGVYTAYWMYRNWKAIKLKSGADMIPFWRGFFVVFWVYALFVNLRKDSEEHYSINKVLPIWLAVIVAISFLAFNVAGNAFTSLPWTFLYVLAPFLLIPFVKYINVRNEHVPEAMVFNTKWRVRHYFTTLLVAPAFVFIVASETHFMPSDRVVKHSQIWDRDLKFLYRQKLIPANETIRYFYSDAFWDVREDGNGFTDKRVFSYWRETSGEIKKEIASFEDIKEIETKFSKSILYNTIVTVTRNDDSTFLLFVASNDGGDKVFVKELKSAWEASKN